ncbi:serine O-acetyltransferase [Prevotella communis]|uniref:Serine O-acetyltransferase n=1 Tax=Prevotella communis TaxID=2913614 RepID=A0A1G7VS95_9BACT|nr:serine acetyltransferase [Prevotella communis]SDG62613.1 serine O-acetyltransferase [Prevotella communis]
MKKILVLFYYVLNSIRFIPHIVVLYLSKNTILWDDAKFWMKCFGKEWGGVLSIFKLLIDHREFRSLFYYRIRIAKLFSFLAPGQTNLYICTPNIGKGLFIHHGFSTVISAKSIGEYCWINQQVTIGHTVQGSPVIGNNVLIAAGAIVVGGITVEDNVTIGAGTTVNKSIPANSLVVGAKPRILENNNRHPMDCL